MTNMEDKLIDKFNLDTKELTDRELKQAFEDVLIEPLKSITPDVIKKVFIGKTDLKFTLASEQYEATYTIGLSEIKERMLQ